MPKRKPRWADRIWICNREWTVEYHDTVRDSEGKPTHGVCASNRQVIQIAHGTPDVCRSSLVHELHHAVIKSTTNMHPEGEEECVQGMETGWYSIFRDPRNKWVWAVLTEDI